MRVGLAAGVLVAFLVLPYALRRPLLFDGSPRRLAWFGVLALLGIAASFLTLLAVLVAPEPLPLTDLPSAVELCIDGVARLIAHPLEHWPSILAAVLLLALVVRIAFGILWTVRDARRARPPVRALAGERDDLDRYIGDAPPGMRVLPTDEALAYTTGLLRPETVLSTGLLRALEPDELAAVVAHERAHAVRRHLLALSIARAIERALGFIPGVRLSARYLVAALEAAADESAAEVVGDRLLVARAIAAVARLRTGISTAAPGMGGGDVAYRVRRLTTPRERSGTRLMLASLVALTVTTIVALGVAWSAGTVALSRERLALALHDTCHLPHEPVRAA